ncbi:MAG: nucleotidyltransferase domain-containing protein [Pseudomonadota bacterium]|nr:nucleotidyltransferase domain-containing protein [Pseudomonadota bacterium]MDP1903796.1 nucleotidyltransferase domain-containing protein [Pseudomonadota bacterium]MDP2353737.1 nucleotidyltransferase domain-containing protein [Pseudomonadota bacterium]
MLSQATLQEAARVLGEAAKPAKVILFGSYARGDADEGSDVDFMVIEPEVDNEGEEAVRLYRVLRPMRLPVDVLVYSEAEVERRRDWCSSAVYWALREGKVLYEAG